VTPCSMSTKLIWTAPTIVLWSVLAAPAPAQSPVTRPAQIILIRHAEKPADEEDPHLSPAGVKRAEQLVSFITTDPAMIRFGPPVAVFATQTTKRGNGQRTQETVAPLARALKLPVQTPLPQQGLRQTGEADSRKPEVRGKDRAHLLEPRGYSIVGGSPRCSGAAQVESECVRPGVRHFLPRWHGSDDDLALRE
jgi:hypothetical protein